MENDDNQNQRSKYVVRVIEILCEEIRELRERLRAVPVSSEVVCDVPGWENLFILKAREMVAAGRDVSITITGTKDLK